jgi:hypothetical protein
MSQSLSGDHDEKMELNPVYAVRNFKLAQGATDPKDNLSTKLENI